MSKPLFTTQFVASTASAKTQVKTAASFIQKSSQINSPVVSSDQAGPLDTPMGSLEQSSYQLHSSYQQSRHKIKMNYRTIKTQNTRIREMRPRNMPLKSRELQQDSIFTSTQFDVLKTNSVDSSASSSRKCEHRAPVTSEELLANPIVKSILQQVDTKNKQVVTSIVPEHVFDKIANQHDGSLEKQFYMVKPICVPGAQTERIDPYPSFNSKNKAKQVHKIYHQMLSNHARAPGPKNRGIRSEQVWDKRPLHEQAYDVQETTKLKANSAKLKELKSFLKSTHQVDEVFHQRDIETLFSKTPKVESIDGRIDVILQQSNEDTFWVKPTFNKLPPLKPDFDTRNTSLQAHSARDTSLFMTNDRAIALKQIQQNLSQMSGSLQSLMQNDGYNYIVKAEEIKEKTIPFQNYVSHWHSRLEQQKSSVYPSKDFYRKYREQKLIDAQHLSIQTDKFCNHRDQCDCHNHVSYSLEEQPDKVRDLRQLHRQKIKQIYRPGVPCRASCSTTHSPRQHDERFSYDRMKRLNQTDAKAMIIFQKQQPAPEEKEPIDRQYDWQRSVLFEEILHEQGLSCFKDSDGFYQLGEPSSDPSPNEQPSLNLAEIAYLIDLLQQQGSIQNSDAVYSNARNTLKRLMCDLLLRDQFYNIDRQYTQCDSNNLLKLLLRVQRINEIRPDVKMIISMVMFLKVKVKQITEHISSDIASVKQLYLEAIQTSSKILRKLEGVQNAEVSLKRDFVIEGVRYDPEYLYLKMKQVRQLVLKAQPHCDLQQVLLPNGRLGDIRLDPDY